MAKKTLPEESPMWLRLQKRTPRGQGPGGIKHWLTDADRLFLLWAWMSAWSNARAARELPCSPAVVGKFHRDLIFDLNIVFELPVMLQVGPRQFQCQYCSDIRPHRIKCMRHVLRHFMPIEWALTAPIERVVIL